MKKVFPILLVLALCAVASCSRTKVIPRSKLSQIYAEMFVADQWIQQHRKGMEADTSLVYEPIFKKYGYTTADYQKTVDKYMDDPESFSEVLDKSAEILRSHVEELRELEIERNKADSIRNVVSKWNILRPEPYAKFFEGQVPTDSIHMELDSNFIWQLVRIHKDTMFSGPRLIIAEKSDTLATADTLAVSDTLEIKEIVSPGMPRPVYRREPLPDPRKLDMKEEEVVLE